MDDVARWDEKLRKKAERVNTGFTGKPLKDKIENKKEERLESIGPEEI